MNEFELALPDKIGFEQMLSGFKRATPVKWDSEKRLYCVSNRQSDIEEYSKGLDKFKSALTDIYSVGSTITRCTPVLCLALRNVFDGFNYVESPDDFYSDEGALYSSLTGIKESMAHKRVDSFLKVISYFGLSDTAAYAYKDLGILVNPDTKDFYDEFKGYSSSLLIEMHGYLKDCHSLISVFQLADYRIISQAVPKDTTVQAMRYYRKIMNLWRKYKFPFDNSDTHDQVVDICKCYKSKITEKYIVSDVIDYYDNLIQEQEQNKLKALTDKAESKDKPDPKELVGNDVLIKQLREQITELKKTAVPNLGKCDGCVYSGVNLNKCRCCRRYKDLKDLFQSN